MNRADSDEVRKSDFILLWLPATDGPKRPVMPEFKSVL